LINRILISHILATGQRHVIETKSEDWDKDKSHITIKPISWWKTYFPDSELFGSLGETI